MPVIEPVEFPDARSGSGLIIAKFFLLLGAGSERGRRSARPFRGIAELQNFFPIIQVLQRCVGWIECLRVGAHSILLVRARVRPGPYFYTINTAQRRKGNGFSPVIRRAERLRLK